MKTRIWKLTALALALLLALTGCSLIEIDQEMDNAEAVATVNGVTITKGDVKNTYDYYVNYYNYMSSYYGTAVDTSTLKDDVVNLFIKNEVIKQKAAELGLDQLTDEDKASVEAKAADELEEYITEHAEDVNTEGMTEEAARAAVLAHLEEEGVTLEALIDADTDSLIADRVRESVTSTVTLEDSDIEEAYNKEVADDESTFTNSAYLYEYYRTNGTTTVYWNPEGYRTVKHILLKLSDEQTAARDALNDELKEAESALAELDNPAEETETAEATEAEPAEGEAAEAETPASREDLEKRIAELNDAIKKLDQEHLDSFSEKIAEIQAKLAEGASFDDLIAEYGEDPGMQREPGMSQGYYVSAASTSWDTAFKDAAMALEKVGDVSEPVLGANGVHIIYYNSDVTPGPVPMDEVRDTLSESVLTDKQTAAYDAAYQTWEDAAKIQKFLNRLG
ncbi:MAG: peptidylprolyl isomerase [Clostridia bacterium]|nr:peptidylprolyl isomerase [Clostridia bacterium]